MKFIKQYFSALFFMLATFTASATIESKWVMRGDSIMLSGSTNLENPKLGKTAILAIAYEKSFFSCKPSIALIIMQGLKLGEVKGQKSSSSKKNQLTLTINNTKYIANKETKLNQYSNGMEIIGIFDDEVLTELAKPSNITVSIGPNNPPRMVFKSIGSINEYIKQAKESC